jgi:tRNA nucleotidyltransferase (CCA-adding enzyme)
MAVYIVGGFVRDLLLERPSLDFDMVVEGDAIALGKALAKKYGGRVTSHTRFGTAKWYVRESEFGRRESSADSQDSIPEFLDLISARTEFYEHPTALPTVERGSIKLDLHRRDFTINTLALRLDGNHYGELHDYWGGLAISSAVSCASCIPYPLSTIPPACCAPFATSSVRWPLKPKLAKSPGCLAL